MGFDKKETQNLFYSRYARNIQGGLVSVAYEEGQVSKIRKSKIHVPGIIYLIISTQIPFLYALWLSLHGWHLLEPYLGKPFVGFHNYYYELFKNPEFWMSIGKTGELVFGSLLLSLVGGTCLAIMLNRPFIGRNILRALILIPFLVTPSVSSIIWKNLMFNSNFGMVNWLFNVLHLPDVAWFSSIPLVSLIIITSWQWTPFFVLIVTAGLQSLPEEVVEASKVDGAGKLRTYIHIILPHLRNYYEAAILLGTIFVFQTFGKIYVATGGGPGSATTTLPFYTYQVAFIHWNIGHATTIGVFGVILAIIVANIMVRFLERDGGAQK